jgi:hypothetical protein
MSRTAAGTASVTLKPLNLEGGTHSIISSCVVPLSVYVMLASKGKAKGHSLALKSQPVSRYITARHVPAPEGALHTNFGPLREVLYTKCVVIIMPLMPG